jgi:glycosyltransferase involved in cell wall biosynthesis
MVVARLQGRRYIVHFHLDVDASGPLGRLLPAYKTHVFGRVLRNAAAVIALTPSQAEFLKGRYGVAEERIHIIANGVEEQYFLPERPVRVAQPGPLRLLFVGRLDAQKNVARLLDAVHLVPSPMTLRVVGDGELRGALEEQARRLGLGVEFSGRLLGAALVDAYRDADVMVLPSDKEGMPLAALEAMAAGLPVVATDVPGNADLLRGVGILADPDAASLAAALTALADDPESRGKVARRCAEEARRHSWDAVTAQVEALYAQVYA